MVKAKSYYILATVVALLPGYIFLAYYIQRHQSLLLISGYTFLFTGFIVLWRFAESRKQVIWLVVVGILFRLALLGAFPNLSDDIYRFVWDGRLINSGFNPFSHLPSYYMTPGSPEITGITSRLYYLLNSPHYFTIYPPVAQFIFSVATSVFPNTVHGSAVIIRLIIIIAEIGSLCLMCRLLSHYKLPLKNVLLYALNPLIILELTGNLHLEAIMILFILAAVYFFLQKRLLLKALAFAFAIGTKLLPLIFMPLFLKKLQGKKLVVFYLLTASATLILFLPLIHPKLVHGMSSSLSLYFQRFEFNASIYYVVREIGYYLKGYNTIETVGIYMAVASFIFIFAYSLLYNPKKVILPEAMLWVLLIYLTLTTTLHPWYIATAVALSVFTNFRFTILWSFLIFFTYTGYLENGFKEVYWLTGIEYVLLFGYIIYEVYNYHFKPKPAVIT